MPNHPAIPEPGPGSLFGETTEGLTFCRALQKRLSGMIQMQVALHAQVRRRVARLEPEMQRLRNSHPALDMEFADYKAFVASDISQLDVASLWSAGNGLAEFVGALDDPRGKGKLSEPIEPEPLALLRALLADHTAFVLGFGLSRTLMARAASRLNIEETPSTTVNLLKNMLAARGLLVGTARPLVRTLTRAFDELEAKTLPWMSATWETTRNALIAFGRSVHRLDSQSRQIDLMSALSGAPPTNTRLAAAAYLVSQFGDISAFAIAEPAFRDWMNWLITDLQDRPEPAPDADSPKVSINASTSPPPAWATDGGRDEFGPYADLMVQDITQRLRWIPPGRFLMGSPDTERDRSNAEGPQHEVTLSSGFWMFATPCTQAFYAVVRRHNPSQFKSPTRPVETVNLVDVQAFLNEVNAKIPGLILALPSEAQWEYACRAGTTTATYVGDIPILGERNAPLLGTIAWYGGNSGESFELQNGVDSGGWREKEYPHTRAGTRPVGLKRPNAFGLFDMLGNVWEWCQDYWHPNYEGAPVDGSAWHAGDSGLRCIGRGGSWWSSAQEVRAAFRDGIAPTNRRDVVGFRCACAG